MINQTRQVWQGGSGPDGIDGSSVEDAWLTCAQRLIITGDVDLLDLDPLQGIPIVTPASDLAR